MILTTREYQVAECVAKDLSEKMIAAELFISPGTVHKHTANIRKKWNVKTSVGIAVKYLQTLENPKNFILASLFIVMQGFIILSGEEFCVRRVRMSRKTSKVRKYEA